MRIIYIYVVVGMLCIGSSMHMAAMQKQQRPLSQSQRNLMQTLTNRTEEQRQDEVRRRQAYEQQLDKQKNEHASQLQELERKLAARKAQQRRREEQDLLAIQAQQREFAAQQREAQKRLERFDDFLLLKARQKELLPGLLVQLLEPLFTVLTELNDQGARRNVRNIIRRMIQAVNEGLPANERIPQDHPDTNAVVPLLIPVIDRAMKADQPLIGSNDVAFIDLLKSLHAGDLQEAVHIAQNAYRGSYSFGDDFTIENFKNEYKNSVAGIVSMGIFEHGKPFEFLLDRPQGNLMQQIDVVLQARDNVENARAQERERVKQQRERQRRQMFQDFDASRAGMLR